HGTDITVVGRNPAYKPAVTYSINHSDIVTAVSQSLKKDSYDNFDITKEIVVVPNFVDLKAFEKEIPCIKRQFAPEGQNIITHISNMRPVKRLHDVIRTFGLIRQSLPARLLMVGDGPEKEPARQLAREIGVIDDVIFVGNAVDIYRVLKCSDLLLLPSEKESFGLVALEAMAAGIPVISTNTGGLPEVNLNGITGFTANVGNVEDMAHYALKLLNDKSLYSRFSLNAIQNARKFSIEKIAPIYIALYEEAVGSLIKK
ncbi:N-acetyl-alpha-D-glucosaminyl L-malate synthase BshA, partial [Schleiferia thermophila]